VRSSQLLQQVVDYPKNCGNLLIDCSYLPCMKVEQSLD
jgi:hypothetical protein